MRFSVLTAVVLAACGPVRPPEVERSGNDLQVRDTVTIAHEDIEPDACLSFGRPEGEFGSFVVESDQALPEQEHFICGVATEDPDQNRCRFDVFGGVEVVSVCNGPQFDTFLVTWHPAVDVLQASVDGTEFSTTFSVDAPIDNAWIDGTAEFMLYNEAFELTEIGLGSFGLSLEEGSAHLEARTLDYEGANAVVGDIRIVHFDESPKVQPVHTEPLEDEVVEIASSEEAWPGVAHGFLEAGAIDVYAIPAGHWRVLSTGDLDTVGEVVDANGNTVYVSDDDGELRNFDITYTEPHEELYLRVAGLYDDVGEYTIELWPADTNLPQDEDVPLYEDAVTLPPSGNLGPAVHEAFLDAGAIDIYLLPMTEGAWWVASTGDLDTYAALVDAAGNTLASSDDDGEALNFEIGFDADTHGPVYLVVNGFDEEGTGSYGIELWRD